MTNTSTPTINAFEEECFFLSNFYPSPMKATFRDVEYEFATGEHLFQGAKIFASTWPEDKQDEWLVKMLSEKAPNRAKYHGRSIKLNPAAWDRMSVSVMRRTQEVKYSNPELAALLLSTGNAHLIEGNTWGDKIWGTVNGVGQNRLGLLIMERRHVLQGNPFRAFL